MLAPTVTMIWEQMVKTKELRMATRKLGLCRMLREVFQPQRNAFARCRDARVTEGIENGKQKRPADEQQDVENRKVQTWQHPSNGL